MTAAFPAAAQHRPPRHRRFRSLGHRLQALQGKVAVTKPLFSAAKLTIAGRDRTKLVEGLAKQVALVDTVMPDLAPGVRVRGALCFVDADLPLVGNLSFGGYPLLYPKR